MWWPEVEGKIPDSIYTLTCIGSNMAISLIHVVLMRFHST